jgi:hypothetical protein
MQSNNLNCKIDFILKNAFFWDVAPCGSGVNTSQKTAFFIVTAVKTSDLTLTSSF